MADRSGAEARFDLHDDLHVEVDGFDMLSILPIHRPEVEPVLEVVPVFEEGD